MMVDVPYVLKSLDFNYDTIYKWGMEMNNYEVGGITVYIKAGTAQQRHAFHLGGHLAKS